MDSDRVWQHTDNERAWLAALLESLPRESWQRPSPCEGWTVRDVGAHLTFARARVHDLLGPAVRASSRYDAVVKDTALRSPLTYEEIVATLRGFVGSRRRVAFMTDVEPSIDILVHIQDICRPLGIDHPMPPDAAAAATDRGLSTPRPLRRWKPPHGVRMIATDVGWAYGANDEVRKPMRSHLLTLTGGRPSRQSRQPQREVSGSP